jgi:hypothetical protein
MFNMREMDMKSFVFVTCLIAGLAAAQAQTVSSPVPLVNTPLVPTAIEPGSHSFVLTLNGNGFTPTSLVHWNGSPRKTTFVSNTQLTARISAADIAVASTALVTVSNPVRHVSNPVLFQITTPEKSIKLQVVPTGLSGVATVADVNADGKPDLIVARPGSVQIALGKGDGTFDTPQVISLGTQPQSIVVGNFYQDGRSDIAVAAVSGVFILHNQGGGIFGSRQKVDSDYFHSIAAADLDGDGWLDLVGIPANSPGYVYVMLRTTGGQFKAPVKYATGTAPNSVAIGDFNRDGIADLAVLNFDDSISILLGNGDGTFQSQTVYPTGNSNDSPGSIIVADFNGDGSLDLARAAAFSPAGTGILLGNGDGTFQPVHDFGDSNYGMAAGDFNGDGILDLTAGANGSGTGIFPGKGDGTFPVVYNFDFQDLGYNVAVGDFNNDGRLDIAATTNHGVVLLMQ